MDQQDPQKSVDGPPNGLTLGQAIRRRRKELGLRQVDLADLADVSTRLVETVESDTASPRLSSITRLCQALGLELVLRPGTLEFRVEGL